jgi:phosphoribosylamine--glycine ligase
MRILLIGSGGREHAMAWKIAQSPKLSKLFCAPGNAGTTELGENVSLAVDQPRNVIDFAKKEKIDLVIIGPEDPLCDGLVDELNASGIRAFGPTRAAARLEGDKVFAKKMMRSRSIPTSEARVFTDYQDARSYVASRESGVVIKASGLAKGKGVSVCDDPATGLIALENIMEKKLFGSAGEQVLVEERLAGPEVSILALVDGQTIYVMESSQDHKPIGEGDTGPNTGGMGAYTPVPMVDERMMQEIESEVLVPIVDALRSENIDYKGVLYAGLMLTHGGPKVLEFNCRFGDPEAQPLLMRLKTDLLEVCDAVADGKLDTMQLEWDPRPSICVVISSGGYPGSYEKGKVITGIDDADAMDDVKVFHAGTSMARGNVVTAGGRVLGVTALGDDLEAAAERCYAAVDKIKFDGAYCRRDIGAKAMKK